MTGFAHRRAARRVAGGLSCGAITGTGTRGRRGSDDGAVAGRITVEEKPLYRPCAVTGGRVEPRYHLAMETLVSSAAVVTDDPSMLTPEQESIIMLCRSVRSVAEISALLRVPPGVARVLTADLADEGLVRLDAPRLDEEQPALNLLERVLSGLRRL